MLHSRHDTAMGRDLARRYNQFHNQRCMPRMWLSASFAVFCPPQLIVNTTLSRGVVINTHVWRQ